MSVPTSLRRARGAIAALALAALAGGAAPSPAAAKAIDVKVPIQCDFGPQQYWGIAPYTVQITGDVPDRVAPGEHVDLTGLHAKFDFVYLLTQMPTVPPLEPASLYGHLFDLGLATTGATAPSLAVPGLPKVLPVATEISWPDDKFDPETDLADISLTAAGAAPVVIRLGTVGLGWQTTRGGAAPPPVIPPRYACTPQDGAPPIAVVPSTGVVPGPPEVTSISPDQGTVLGGEVVTIKGKHLATTKSLTSTFGAAYPLKWTVVDDETITVTMPKLPGYYQDYTGESYLTLTTDFGKRDDLRFKYVDAPPADPTITSLSPTRAPDQGPTEVTITGTNLDRAAEVKFGTWASADILELSPDGTRLRVRVGPSYANRGAGKIDVTVRGVKACASTCVNTNTPADDFEFFDAGPQVWNVQDTNGATAKPGDEVLISGFALEDTTQVLFGDVPAASFEKFGEVAVYVRAVIPAGVSGKVRVTAIGKPGGLAPIDTPGDEITVDAPPVLPTTPPVNLPAVTGVSGFAFPWIGGIVNVRGTNLANAKTVKVGTRSVRPLATSRTSVWIVAPALPRGAYPVSVTTAAGQSAAGVKLTYR